MIHITNDHILVSNKYLIRKTCFDKNNFLLNICLVSIYDQYQCRLCQSAFHLN